MTGHTRVIMPHVHIMRSFDDEAGKRIVVSGVLLPHLIENLILSGALEVLITDGWRYSNDFHNELEKLPPSSRRYVNIINADTRTQRISDEIFEPVLEEFGLRLPHSSAYVSLRKVSSKEERTAREAAMRAHGMMPRFLEALFHKAHFHFDIKGFVSCLEIVRLQSRDADTRIKLAGLQAVLSTYKPFEMSAALVLPEASKAHADRLMEIVLSSEYKALSAEHSALGGLTNISHVVSQIDLRVRKLLNRSGTKGLLRYTSKAASAASGVPVPTTDFAESLIKDAFLPPTLDMSDIISRAKQELAGSDGEIDKRKFLGL
ncbi:hypothetical protein [Pararhodobacter marinus]|uniref:hypothetical protein n=1 Tax=Pararhodobacter marinus TaxID=2184063 RepID=UPI0011B27C99|nr:hypothetical protein [Pararhodobacter marinus]